ncbi:PspA/IM30 family protein [Bacillus sp. E214]|uniref:PspA/IM30 family protein n=1 Tax=Bacillus sp. E214 TaxID=2587156 RepID=UPI0011DFE0C0|nr:PspA/IM30 family protein [Bacillus sp. E214]
MANLFTRMKNSVEADLHDLIDKQEERNPISKLNQYLRQSEREVEQVQQLIQRQYRLKEEIKRELAVTKEMADKRKHQAYIAKEAGDVSELYEFAIKEQAVYEDRSAKIEHLLVQIGLDLKQLEEKFTLMKQKLKDMHIKRLELMGRENIAKVHHKMDKLMESGKDAVEGEGQQSLEIDDYMMQIENRVKANYYEATIDTRIAEIEKDLKRKETVN